ncbi:hypothetical protein TNCV_3376941 [Trichonephila clavipes]|nr:hypothetical protein TNCV_3376941 [Trichonephila clavipes]
MGRLWPFGGFQVMLESPGFPKRLETLATVNPILAADEVCPLCGRARMDDDHLFLCAGLDEYPTDHVDSRNWEAWRQMVKKPSTDVG